MREYLDMVKEIFNNGEISGDRTGVGTHRIPGLFYTFDLSEGFSIVTTKFTSFRLFASELLWFLKGDMDLRSLLHQNNHIWTEWGFKPYAEEHLSNDEVIMRYIKNEPLTDDELNYCKDIVKQFEENIVMHDEFSKKYGDFRPCYGYQWRHYPGIDFKTNQIVEVDQIKWVLNEAKSNPNNRRLIVTAWNPAQIKDMKLPSCHEQFQLLIINGKLNLIMYQRSCDTFLGVPFNIGQYALLTHIFANALDLEVGKLIYVMADAHLYRNHDEQVQELLTRQPKEKPQLVIKRKLSVEDIINNTLSMDDFELVGYEYHPSIKASVAI